MIEVKNLTKRYGNHLAVDHLNFTVESGKIYGFLGPNGAGKSTTMNIMTGYLGATEGQVLIDGIVPYFHKYVFHAASGARFTLASLGNDAGAYGAFKLALDAFHG